MTEQQIKNEMKFVYLHKGEKYIEIIRKSNYLK